VIVASQAAWILRSARVALGPHRAAPLDIEISRGKIRAIEPYGQLTRRRGVQSLDLTGGVILPGLINAHDHLELNLFPRLGRGTYRSAAAWARDIYRPSESPIAEQLRLSKRVRLLWGGLKNLLSGVTTVCHHNPSPRELFDRDFPVRVLGRLGWAHSLEFTPDMTARLGRTPHNWPFVLHLGEATDGDGSREIFQLDEMGALDHRTVLVHAVALDRKGWRLARRKGASVIWCPSSNLFLLGRTLNPKMLPAGIPLALGTDSALTAEGDLLDELRLAERVANVSRRRLWRMVTSEAARILRLPDGAGALAVGAPADLVVFRGGKKTPAEILLNGENQGPLLVLVGGRVKLATPSLAAQLPASIRSGLFPLGIAGRRQALVAADVPKLIRRTELVLGRAFRLAGKQVLS
jgi:cytosine/adenosine deaminase-related metal-dependent hydrolase